MTKGYVYILTNEAMPGLVKIGKTTRDPASRALELHQTGVPFPFTVALSVFAPDCHELERAVHADLNDCRVRPDREFFRCDFHTADRSLVNCHRKQVEIWLDEYLPDHTPVQADYVVDESITAQLADAHGLHMVEMIDAFGLLTADEVAGAVTRLHARYDANRARMDSLCPFPNGGRVK